jgi:DNA-directed RNA polymerase subunit RPC12/RpoP
LKRQSDIANFPKKRASRKIMTAYRRALTNPNVNECAICLGAMLNPTLTTTLYYCKHTFHSACIKKWAANKLQPRCPLCKARILYYEHPTIVKPTLQQQNFMNKLKRTRDEARYEAEQVQKAISFISRSQDQLINRTARDGSSVRMTRAHKQKLEEQISAAQTTLNIHNKWNYRAKLLELEQQLAANIIRDREIATNNDASILQRDNERYNDGTQHGGGAHCRECVDH